MREVVVILVVLELERVELGLLVQEEDEDTPCTSPRLERTRRRLALLATLAPRLPPDDNMVQCSGSIGEVVV